MKPATDPLSKRQIPYYLSDDWVKHKKTPQSTAQPIEISSLQLRLYRKMRLCGVFARGVVRTSSDKRPEPNVQKHLFQPVLY